MYQDEKVMKNSKFVLNVLFLMKELNYDGLCILRIGLHQLGIFSILNHDNLLKKSYFIGFSQERNLQPILFLILKLIPMLFDD